MQSVNIDLSGPQMNKHATDKGHPSIHKVPATAHCSLLPTPSLFSGIIPEPTTPHTLKLAETKNG